MMITLAILSALAIISASTSHRRQDQGVCCFEIDAHGTTSRSTGIVGQLYDGQNRINGGYGTATYCINNSNGTISDKDGRGCILTPPTSQWQCDEGAEPTSDFSINSEGFIQHNGDSSFYACPYNEVGMNIYKNTLDGQLYCVEINMTTVSTQCAAPAPPQVVTVTSCAPPVQTTYECPAAPSTSETPLPPPPAPATPDTTPTPKPYLDTTPVPTPASYSATHPAPVPAPSKKGPAPKPIPTYTGSANSLSPRMSLVAAILFAPYFISSFCS